MDKTIVFFFVGVIQDMISTLYLDSSSIWEHLLVILITHFLIASNVWTRSSRDFLAQLWKNDVTFRKLVGCPFFYELSNRTVFHCRFKSNWVKTINMSNSSTRAMMQINKVQSMEYGHYLSHPFISSSRHHIFGISWVFYSSDLGELSWT